MRSYSPIPGIKFTTCWVLHAGLAIGRVDFYAFRTRDAYFYDAIDSDTLDFWENCGRLLTKSPLPWVHLSHLEIIAHERGKGYGSEVLAALYEHATRIRASTLTLTPVPFDRLVSGAMVLQNEDLLKKERLRNWYLRLGLKPVPGSDHYLTRKILRSQPARSFS